MSTTSAFGAPTTWERKKKERGKEGKREGGKEGKREKRERGKEGKRERGKEGKREKKGRSTDKIISLWSETIVLELVHPKNIKIIKILSHLAAR